MIKDFKATMTIDANFNEVVRYFVVVSSFWKSLSKFYSYFTVFFFIDQIRINSRKNFIDSISIYKPFMPYFPIFIFSFSRILESSKCLVKEINQWFMGIHNIQSQGVGFPSWILYRNTSLSINDSCKIRNSSLIPFHKDPKFSLYKFNIDTTKHKGRERLSEKDPIRVCDSLTRTTKGPEGDPKRSSRLEIGHKSNRMVLNEAAARLGVSLRQTEDQLTRDMLASTASFINCVGGTNGDNPTEIERSDIDSIIATLATNNAYTISDHIEGEDKFGTAPVRDAYFALGSTHLIGNLENVSGFISKAQYPSPMQALRAEWGSISNLRFLLSSIGSSTANASMLGSTVYNVFCVGMEAFSVIEQDGYSASFIYRPPIYDGPLALNASVGYKFAQVPRITNDQWVLNLRCTLA